MKGPSPVTFKGALYILQQDTQTWTLRMFLEGGRCKKVKDIKGKYAIPEGKGRTPLKWKEGLIYTEFRW